MCKECNQAIKADRQQLVNGGTTGASSAVQIPVLSSTAHVSPETLLRIFSTKHALAGSHTERLRTVRCYSACPARMHTS